MDTTSADAGMTTGAGVAAEPAGAQPAATGNIASPSSTPPEGAVAVLGDILTKASALGVATLALTATVPDSSGSKPGYLTVGMSLAQSASTKTGKIADLLSTLSTAIDDEATLSESMVVEGGYTCSVSLAR